MIILKDSEGIRIGRYDDEVSALIALDDLLKDREPEKPVFRIDQDGVTTHEGYLVREIRRVEK
jgi:hypothetical protein